PPIRELCRGKRRPLIVVDDPNRPTPVGRVLPHVLAQLRAAGIAARDVTILLATGTHGAPAPETVVKKVGTEAASSCRVLVHDAGRDLVRAGTTALGTPVFVNRAVVESDVLLGIGGIYPNHTAGFGGGSKLALGVLGLRSIMHLHFRHEGAGWG